MTFEEDKEHGFFQTGWLAFYAGQAREDAPHWSDRNAVARWRDGWDAAREANKHNDRTERFDTIMRRADCAPSIESLREVVKDLIELVKEKDE